MGRPPAPPEQVRRNRVVVMLTDIELAALHRVADAAERPPGTVAHDLLTRALRKAK